MRFEHEALKFIYIAPTNTTVNIYTQQKKKRHYVSFSNTFKPLILK